MSIEDWRWCGNGHHFIGAQHCRFHLATRVGDVLVSTVGEYRPPSEGGEMVSLGFIDTEMFYETMVFPMADSGTDCPLGGSVGSWDEHTLARYATAGQAVAGHFQLCREHDTLEVTS